MAKFKVLVTEPIDRLGMELLAAEDCEGVVSPEPSLSALLRLAPDVDGFIVRAGPCPRQLMEAAPSLKVIGKHGVGVDNIDIPAATALGIPVFSTPGTNSEGVAEMALALMLALARRLSQAHSAVVENRYVAGRAAYLAVELEGQTLGLVGVGRIGSRLAQMCTAALGMRVLAYDPYVSTPPSIGTGKIEMITDLTDVLRQADFVSVHVPLTPETRGIIGGPQLARMKSTAYLVNTSRGAVVDEEALAVALRGKVIAGAGIDVFAQEPTPAQHPLFGLDNIILSPHIGGQTAESMQKMARVVVEGVLAGMRGERPANVLNPVVYERK
ncbi:MAG: hydroxyacid dehydrogenase [Chloroflexota bacterium]